MIYLDNAATTAVCREAAEAFAAAAAQFGNPSSLHEMGFTAERLVTDARETVAASLGAKREEIFFTPGGTYSDNLAIRGTAKRRGDKRGHIITTAIEHPAVLNTVRALEEEGFTATYLTPDATGHVSADDALNALRPDTFLVSMMLVNNELGTIQPVAETAKRVKALRPDVIVHTDAVQAYRKTDVNVRTLGVDLLALSAHKIHAYKGVGAIYIRRGTRIAPILTGGGQESGMAPGTEPVPLIAALAAAAKLPMDEQTLRERKEYAIRAALGACPQAVLLSPGDAGGIFALSLPGLRGETVMHALEQRGICVSTGSACGRGKPSHVLAALPIDKAMATGMIRVSLSRDTTTDELDRFAAALAEVCTALTPKNRRAADRRP